MNTPPPLPLAGDPAAKPVPTPLIAALCLAGPLALLLAWFASGMSRPDAGLSYRIGYVLGALTFIPLLAVALFSMGRRYRTATARAVVVLVAWVFAIVGSLGTLGVSSGLALANNAIKIRHDDQKVAAELRARIAEINRQIAATSDLNEAARLQGELRAAMEDAARRLSPGARAGMEVMIQAVDPMMNEAQSYTKEVAAFFESIDGELASATSQEEVKARMAALDTLVERNAALTRRVESVAADAERFVEVSKLSRAMKRSVLQGFLAEWDPQLEGMRAIRSCDAQVFEQLRLTCALLHDQWGHWRRNDDGMVAWETDEQVARYNSLVAEIQRLAAEQQAVQMRMLDKPAAP